ncbi:hypothetical protein [Lysinibacillus fusiformis]|uniref:hypothetical protein n=1 Tax=Lysinibacillus fusiformis TaxID=28031 RepID=UPI003D0635F6
MSVFSYCSRDAFAPIVESHTLLTAPPIVSNTANPPTTPEAMEAVFRRKPKNPWTSVLAAPLSAVISILAFPTFAIVFSPPY